MVLNSHQTSPIQPCSWRVSKPPYAIPRQFPNWRPPKPASFKLRHKKPSVTPKVQNINFQGPSLLQNNTKRCYTHNSYSISPVRKLAVFCVWRFGNPPRARTLKHTDFCPRRPLTPWREDLRPHKPQFLHLKS